MQYVAAARAEKPKNYHWIALFTTTLGTLMATMNSSIILIALPDIFRGIHLNPLAAGNSTYLLWLIMSFLVTTAAVLVSLGRIGDMFGRIRIFTFGFGIFSVFSILLSITFLHGPAGALWLILMRIGQGLGGSCLFANANAIITDAFPPERRGLALGVNGVAMVGGAFIGLVVGGVLAPIEWHLVFLVSVPFGILGTAMARFKLIDTMERRQVSIDWWGNLTFALSLVSILVAITYSIEPYGGHIMGWTSPRVIGGLILGLILGLIFITIELRADYPMFRLELFRIRAFSMGNLATFLAGIGRGGFMFILIMWLQGIWLPEHGYSFALTPLWAGIYMLPLTVGFIIAGPLSGMASDRFGARPFAVAGMLITALGFLLFLVLPVNFTYLAFAALLLLMGLGMGTFSAPNQAGVMNSLPPEQRGVGAGMLMTAENSAMVLSIGVFFSLVILGLASTLPHTLFAGLTAQHVPAGAAHKVANLPPVESLFAAFLGYNPIQVLLGGTLAHLGHARAVYLTGRRFFPGLLSAPFKHGLSEAFGFASLACLVAAGASLLRGGRYVHDGSAVKLGPAEQQDASGLLNGSKSVDSEELSPSRR